MILTIFLLIFGIFFWGIVLLKLWRFVATQRIRRRAIGMRKVALEMGEMGLKAQLRAEGIELPEIHPEWGIEEIEVPLTHPDKKINT